MPTPRAKKTGTSAPSEEKTFSLISDAKLKQLYATMLQCRLLDDHLKSASKRAPGKLRYSPLRGQEAVISGALIDLRSDDWVLTSPGNFAASFVQGVSIGDLLAGKTDEKRKVLEVELKPAVQLSIAAGMALALESQRRGSIVIAYTSLQNIRGDSLDALRYAASRLLPMVVVTRGKIDRRVKPGSKRKSDLNFPVIPVDESDVVAIYRVASESIHKARHQGGPTLIRTVAWKQAPSEMSDPIFRMQEYLAAKGLFSAEWKNNLAADFARKLARP